jgi:membrane protein implicated in regulation of membrane protease activity
MTVFFAIAAIIGGTVLACQMIMSLVGIGHDTSGLDVGHSVGFDHGGFDQASVDHGGLGHDSSTDHAAVHPAHSNAQHDSSWFFGVVTFRTVIAAITFFGLVGLAGQSADLSTESTLVAATLSAVGAMFAVHSMMRGLHRLKSDGTARIERAVGQSGTVYLRIPAHKAGVGKVLVNVQNRTMEYQAMTNADELPTGAPVVVVHVLGPETVEVALAVTNERNPHA